MLEKRASVLGEAIDTEVQVLALLSDAPLTRRDVDFFSGSMSQQLGRLLGRGPRQPSVTAASTVDGFSAALAGAQLLFRAEVDGLASRRTQKGENRQQKESIDEQARARVHLVETREALTTQWRAAVSLQFQLEKIRVDTLARQTPASEAEGATAAGEEGHHVDPQVLVEIKKSLDPLQHVISHCQLALDGLEKQISAAAARSSLSSGLIMASFTGTDVEDSKEEPVSSDQPSDERQTHPRTSSAAIDSDGSIRLRNQLMLMSQLIRPADACPKPSQLRWIVQILTLSLPRT